MDAVGAMAQMVFESVGASIHFGEFCHNSINFHENDVEIVSYLQKSKSSTDNLKCLTTTLSFSERENYEHSF